MPIETEHFSGISSGAESYIDPALEIWARAEIEQILKTTNPEEAANIRVLELSGKARKTLAMNDRLKAWLFCKGVADALGVEEVLGQQQILAGFAYMHPTVDKGYYTEWIKTHPGPDDAPRADEDLTIYSDIFSPDDSKK